MITRNLARNWTFRNLATRPSNPTTNGPVALLFPGQGAQYVGMANKYLGVPGAREVFDIARDILGYDLLKLCTKGPDKLLKLTYYCQPAILATSLAALRFLQHSDPDVLERVVATAGFSVGELTSLAVSRAISIEDAFSVVRVRAKAMHDASIEPPSGMMSVRGLDITQIEELCVAAEDQCKREGVEGVAVIGNYLYPRSVSVSGSDNALAIVSEQASELGAKVKRLKVAGAFHSPLMCDATESLRRVLVGTPVSVPAIPVYSNVTGSCYTDPIQLKELFSRQLQMSVRWQALIENMIREHGQELEFYEVGPSRHICAMIKHINRASRVKATDQQF